MSKLEVPKYEINTREALQNTLVNGICHTVRNMENGTIVDFKEIVEDLKIEDLPYLHLKQQAIKEAKLRLNNVLTYVDDMILVDRNHIQKDQIEAMKLERDAMNKIKDVIEQMKQQHEALTEEAILEHLIQQDERNEKKYATWLKVFWTQGMLEEKTDKEEEREM